MKTPRGLAPPIPPSRSRLTPRTSGAVGAVAGASEAGNDAADLAIVRAALGDEYDVLDELGRGAMGVVYRARERGIDRLVAIKVLPVRLTGDESVVERFEREGKVAAQLEHPGIVPVYRVGRSGAVIYFVMQLLRGQSLAARLRKSGPMGAPEVRHILRETARALGHAAHRGVVHRDVKPDNIVLDHTGRPVLTDFGIARSTVDSKLTAQGITIGTPRYMSPEQARAQKLDGRSDIYSLGIVGYECLVGTPPFDTEDAVATLVAQLNSPLPRPTLASDEEWALFAIIERMLAKDPADRFQTADELIAALEEGEERRGPERHWHGRGRWGTRAAWGARARTFMARRGTRVVGAVVLLGALGGVVLGGRGIAAERRSRCPVTVPATTAAGRAREFAVLLDGIEPLHTGRKLDVNFDVCGLAAGSAYTAVLSVTPLESARRSRGGRTGSPVFRGRMYGTAKGRAVREHQRLPFDRMPAGRYVLEVSVTDGAGRQRAARAIFQVVAS